MLSQIKPQAPVSRDTNPPHGPELECGGAVALPLQKAERFLIQCFDFLSHSDHHTMSLAQSVPQTTAQRAVRQMTDGYGSGGCKVPPASTNSTGCLLASKTRHRDGGYVKMKLPGLSDRQEYYIHHLAIVASGDASLLIGGDLQVSHLCHNPLCFKREHLLLESGRVNRDRSKCKGWTWITCPHGGEKFNPCQHSPQCILPQ